jgi:hypothetical protein
MITEFDPRFAGSRTLFVSLQPLFPAMRPPWLQPADRLAPMPEEQRTRMWCAAPNDCWLHQTS